MLRFFLSSWGCRRIVDFGPSHLLSFVSTCVKSARLTVSHWYRPWHLFDIDSFQDVALVRGLLMRMAVCWLILLLPFHLCSYTHNYGGTVCVCVCADIHTSVAILARSVFSSPCPVVRLYTLQTKLDDIMVVTLPSFYPVHVLLCTDV